MQVVDSSGNVFGQGLEITDKNGKPKVPVINTDITIGTTAIVGGVSGRLLYDNAGVVGETNGVHWDKVNSRLGLGTTTPTQTLDIQGNISIGLSAATTVRAYYNSTTRNQLIYTNTSSLEFFQSITERMRLAPGSGNLLLNTTTDAGFRLDINGTARIQGVLTAAGNYIQYGTNLNVGIGSTNNGSSFVNNGPALLYASANISATQVYAHNFFTGSFNSTSGVQGLANLTGANFSPTSGTAVFNTINATPTINQTGGASGITRGLYINPTLTAAADFRAIETTAGNVLFGTTSGNVGIGTTNPIYNLEVVSSTGYAGIGIRSAQNNNAELSFQNAGYSVPRWTIRASGAANGSSGSLVFQRNAATFPMVITSGDNVLIGTSIDSGYKLNVNGSVYFQNTGTSAVTHTLLFRNENNSYGGLTIASSGLPLTIFQASGYGYLTATGFSINSTNSTIWTNNGSLLDIKNAAGNTTYVRLASTTGNVLINTTTDAGYKLDVNGTARFSGQTFIQSAAGSVGLVADFGQTNSRIQFESHGSNDFTQIKIGNNFSLSRNGGSNPSITTTSTFDFKVPRIDFSSSSNVPSKIFISGNYGLGSAYFGASNSNGTTASTLYFQNSITPLAVQNVIATFNLWGMSDNATIPTIPASSMFSLESTTRGFLPPRMSNAQMLAIATPATSLMVYDTTNNKLCCYDGTTWQNLF